MAQEFKVKNGLIVDQGGATITGSLIASIPTYGLNTSTGRLTSASIVSLAWDTRFLTDAVGDSSIACNDRTLHDSAETIRVDWNSGILSDAVPIQSINWEERALYDTGGNRSIHYDNRYLIYPNGTSPALDYSTQNQITINGGTIITGSVAIGTSSLGPFENTLTLGARDTGAEGGQLGLNAPGGTYTSASFIDNWQNQFRILRGNNASSDATVASWNMHTKQMTLSAYNSAAAFTGSSVALLAVDSNGNVITNGRLSTYRSSGTGSMVGTGTTSLTATTSFLIPANTFTTGDILRVRYRVRKLATNANTTTGIYINTTNDISTATTLGILTANTTSMQMKRDFYILSATGINTEHVGVGTSLATDDAATGRAASTIDWSVDQYIIFGITHTNTNDSAYSTMYYLERV